MSSPQPDAKEPADFSLFESLAESFGTPFYAYDEAELQARAAELKSWLPGGDRSRLYFSFKSNPNPSVAGVLNRAGCRADLTSSGELEAAREAGFDLSLALYGGPGKSADELLFAVENGVENYSIESERDLAALAEATGRAGRSVRGLIRVNPMEAPRAKLAMSGVPSQFGFEEEDLRSSGDAIVRAAGPNIDLAGFHIYWGTQIGDAEALLACFERTVASVAELSGILGIDLRVLNLGGGFPWPYSKRGEAPDLSPLGEGLEALRKNAGAVGEAEWWFESGRYLCASSGTLVTRVMDLKTSKEERRFLILDTGIHHLGGMAGLGRIPRFSIDLEVPPSRCGNEEITVDVVGQLCTPLDCIGRRIKLPAVEPGDLVCVPNVGAYGPTASVLGFLSRPTPVEILHRDREVLAAHRIRRGHEEFGVPE